MHLSQPELGTPSRLLLANATTVTVSAKGNDGATILPPAQTVTGSSVTFTMALFTGVTYRLTATAKDASGIAVFQGTSASFVAGQTSSLTLDLLPIKTDGTTKWPTLSPDLQPTGGSSGTATPLASGKSTSFLVDFGSIATEFTLSTPAAGLTAYLQNPDGTSLTLPADRRVLPSSLGATKTFWLTYYQSGAGNADLSALGQFTIPTTAVVLNTPSLITDQTPATLTYTVTPTNATNQAATDFTWSSDTPGVATVDASGVVTAAAGSGTAVITATSKAAAAVTSSVTVTVSHPAAVLTLTAPGYEDLSLNVSATTVAQGTPVTFTTANATLSASASTWEIQVDGVSVYSGPYASLAIPGTVAIGKHTADVLVTYNKVSYSATFNLTVTQ